VRLLFVHQNFPGQYRHLASHFARQKGNEVVALGEKGSLLRNRPFAPGIKVFGYQVNPQSRGFEAPVVRAIERGRATATAATQMRRAGFRPDVIFTHLGWGEALFLKDVFPDAKVLLYCEFFYRAQGGDLGFDPEFPPSRESLLRVRVMNAPLLMSLDASDWGIAPTYWQQRQFPAAHRSRMSVVHDGIDTDFVSPAGEKDSEELVTYVARNLEPYRGFHVFSAPYRRSRSGARTLASSSWAATR
jgi:hypothetical protein